jgi:hypothetical protein
MRMSSRNGRSTVADPQLHVDGYCIAQGLLSPTMLSALRTKFGTSWQAAVPRHCFGSAGAFVPLPFNDPAVTELLTWPPALEALATLGFEKPPLHSFYASTKPPGATELLWHSDLFYPWSRDAPAEVFLVYALEDTDPANGCLRVLPGSHLRRDGFETMRHQREVPDIGPRRGEVSIALKPGDLFVGDRRLLHSTHANRSHSWRTCFTVSLVVAFDELSPAAQSLICMNPCLPQCHWREPGSGTTLAPRLSAILPSPRNPAGTAAQLARSPVQPLCGELAPSAELSPWPP